MYRQQFVVSSIDSCSCFEMDPTVYVPAFSIVVFSPCFKGLKLTVIMN